MALCAKTGRFVNNFAHDEMNVPALSQRYLTVERVLPLPAAGKWPSLRRRCSQQRNNDATAAVGAVRQPTPPGQQFLVNTSI
jgi:hypothetical protein